MKKSKHEQNEPVVMKIIGRIVVKMWSQIMSPTATLFWNFMAMHTQNFP